MFVSEGANDSYRIDRDRGETRVGLLGRAAVFFVGQHHLRLNAGSLDYGPTADLPGNLFDNVAACPVHVGLWFHYPVCPMSGGDAPQFEIMDNQ